MRLAQSFPALETARLRLRAVKPDDHVFYHALLSIPQVTRFGDFPDAPSKAQSDRILNWMAKRFGAGKGCAWIIEEGKGGAPVGAIRINRIDRLWRWGEIGYESHPDFWGRGLMTEAVRAVVACAHSRFELHRVEAWTLPGNDASDRVLAKTGFVHEGTLKQKAWFKAPITTFACSDASQTIRSAEPRPLHPRLRHFESRLGCEEFLRPTYTAQCLAAYRDQPAPHFGFYATAAGKREAAPPVFCRFAFVGPPVIERLDRFIGVGARSEGAAFGNRVQGRERRGHEQAERRNQRANDAPAEVGHQLPFGAGNQTRLRHAADELVDGHTGDFPSASVIAGTGSPGGIPAIRAFRRPRR